MSYLTKDQLENYLNALPSKPTHTPSRDYQQLKKDLTYEPKRNQHVSDIKTPKTPRPLSKVSVTSPLYVGQECSACHQQVHGSVVSVPGNGVWHSHCFTCKVCHRQLENESYFEKDGDIYCSIDYRRLFTLYCDTCGEPIERQVIRALGKYYHQDHFICCVCKQPFGDQQFMVLDDQPYCQEDYLKKCGKKCSGCGEYLQGEYINALNQEWHKSCFHCTVCKQPFPNGSFMVKDNKPYCEQHYPRHVAGREKPPVPTKPASYTKPTSSSPSSPVAPTKPSILKPTVPNPSTLKPSVPKSSAASHAKKVCHVCQNIIDGPCANALGHDYHIHHFQCSRCNRALSSRVPGMWQGDSRGELVCKMCINKHG